MCIFCMSHLFVDKPLLSWLLKVLSVSQNKHITVFCIKTAFDPLYIKTAFEQYGLERGLRMRGFLFVFLNNLMA